jgi:NTP pyrophosphatase (non-canonical NTP hydrolase)
MNIPEIIKEHHQMMVNKGFHDIESRGISKESHIGELLAMIVGELCGEALEAHRNNRFADKEYLDMVLACMANKSTSGINVIYKNLAGTLEEEIANVFLRLFDLCGYLKVEVNHNEILIDQCGVTNNVGHDLYRITLKLPDLNIEDWDEHPFDWFYTFLILFCEHYDIPIEKHILAKMAYNKTRPHKHGKEY